jgi:hypothetical protein
MTHSISPLSSKHLPELIGVKFYEEKGSHIGLDLIFRRKDEYFVSFLRKDTSLKGRAVQLLNTDEKETTCARVLIKWSDVADAMQSLFELLPQLEGKLSELSIDEKETDQKGI